MHLVIKEGGFQHLLLRVVEAQLVGSTPGAGQGVQGTAPSPLPTGGTCDDHGDDVDGDAVDANRGHLW